MLCRRSTPPGPCAGACRGVLGWRARLAGHSLHVFGCHGQPLRGLILLAAASPPAPSECCTSAKVVFPSVIPRMVRLRAKALAGLVLARKLSRHRARLAPRTEHGVGQPQGALVGDARRAWDDRGVHLVRGGSVAEVVTKSGLGASAGLEGPCGRVWVFWWLGIPLIGLFTAVAVGTIASRHAKDACPPVQRDAR